jgi:hypothetical protein
MVKNFFRRMVASGDFQIAGLAGRLTETSREIADYRRGGRHATLLVLSEPMRADPSRNGLDFATLKDPPAKTVLVVLDADRLRLVIACALNALYRRGGEVLRTLFVRSKFAQLGHLKPIMTALGQIADMTSRCGYRRTSTVNRLRASYKPDAVAVSGIVPARCRRECR